jgi:hypothetical protein
MTRVFRHQALTNIKIDSWVPHQHTTTRGLRSATDFYEQRLVKFPEVGEFHSYAEYLYAGLNEGNSRVATYIPQPFQLRYQGQRYTPDVYVVCNGKRWVIELKPRAEFDPHKQQALAAFFAQHAMTFAVFSNEDILAREREALNWLTITRELVRAEDIDTQQEEQQLLWDWPEGESMLMQDWIDPGDRERTYTTEIALLRLVHRGLLLAELTEHTLNFNTVFARCRSGDKP